MSQISEDWGWFVHIDEEQPIKNIFIKHIAIPCTIKEEEQEEQDYEIHDKIKKYESNTYLYISCIVSILTFIVSKL